MPTWASAAATAAALALAAAGCGTAAPAAGAPVRVVAGENQYGDVAAQIGGRWVRVTSVLANPSADPHSFEATTSVAKKVAAAGLLIENGLGYDAFMARLAAATSTPGRRLIDVQHLLRLPDSTPNPHLWYRPSTMPAVAAAVAGDLAALDPQHAAAFRTNEAAFLRSLSPLDAAITAFRAAHAGTPAATTEPVADDLLDALGVANLVPFRFQAAEMDGTDPTPQDVAAVRRLVADRRVRFLCVNQQVTDTLTAGIRRLAASSGVPVVGVSETMPTPGYHYQSWMLAEVAAITRAVDTGASTARL